MRPTADIKVTWANAPYWHALWWASLVTWWWASGIDWQIEKVSILPGIATFDGISIGKRVSSFYLAGALFSLAFGGLAYAFSKLKHFAHAGAWMSRTSLLAQLGLMLLLASVFRAPQHESIPIVLVAFAFTIIQPMAFPRASNRHAPLIFSFSQTLALSFTIKYFSLWVLSLPLPVPFWLILSACWLLAIALSRYYEKKKWKGLLQVLIASSPLTLLIAIETSWIIEQASRLGLVLWVFLTINGIVLTTCSLIARRNKRLPQAPIYALSLLGIVLLSTYNPTGYTPSDMFELANPANAVMRTWQFGEWPLIDYLNSHLFSELLFRFFYTLVNGYSENASFILYDFLAYGITAMAGYWVLCRLFRSKALAFIMMLTFPFWQIGFTNIFAIGLFTLYFIQQALKKWRLQNLLKLGAWLVLMLLWRLDTGLSSTLATVVILLIHALTHNRLTVWKRLIFAVGIILLSVVAIFLLLLIVKPSLWSSFQQALSYFGAAQAHGFSQLTNETDALFYLHHVIFPLGVLTIMLLVLRKRLSGATKWRFIEIGLLFSGVFIVVNFQRGLVRHSFMEHTDLHLNSLIWLFTTLSLLYFIKPLRKHPGIVLLLISLVIVAFKVPLPVNQKSILTEGIRKSTTAPQGEEIPRNRMAKKPHKKHANALAFSQFMQNNYADSATFIDLSITPMWYYYSNRPVPSYFNQYMQNTVTPFLQETNLAQLDGFHIPIAVVQQIPLSWWDKTDDVPNTIRYYQIMQHVFEYYKPAYNIGHHAIWIKEDADIDTTKPLIDSATSHDVLHYELRNYPQFARPSQYNKAQGILLPYDSAEHKWLVSKERCTLQWLKIKSEATHQAQTCTLSYQNEKGEILGQYSFTYVPDKLVYFIPVSAQFNWCSLAVKKIDIKSMSATFSEVTLMTNSRP